MRALAKRDQLAPRTALRIDGKPLPSWMIVSDVKVVESLEKASSVVVELQSPVAYRKDGIVAPLYLDREELLEGKTIEVWAGYGSRLKLVGGFIIYASEPSIGNQPRLIIKGADARYLLMDSEHHRTWERMTDAEVVRQIIRSLPQSVRAEVEQTSGRHSRVQRGNDYEFIRKLCSLNGYELLASYEPRAGARGNHSLIFRKVRTDDPPVARFRWSVSPELLDFSAELTTRGDVTTVEAIWWNRSQKRAMRYRITRGEGGAVKIERAGYVQNPAEAGKVRYLAFGRAIRVETKPFNSFNALKKWAESVFNNLQLETIQGSGELVGSPDYHAGQVLEIEFGRRLSGRYYVYEMEHNFGDGYRCHFQALKIVR